MRFADLFFANLKNYHTRKNSFFFFLIHTKISPKEDLELQDDVAFPSMKSLIMEVLSCLGFSKKACGKIYPKSEYSHPVPTISCLDYCSSHPIGLLSSKLIELRSVLYEAANVTSEGGNHIINSSVQTLQRPSYSVMSFCYIS